MDVREKLVELVKSAIIDWEHGDVSEWIADNLIANGVTVQEDCKECAEATQNCIVKLQEQIAELRSAQEWIPSSEPPTRKDADKYGRVLAMEMGMIELVNYKGPINHPDRFPYWMPLPKPPKGE